MTTKEIHLVTISAYADLWDVTRKTVSVWIKKGLLTKYFIPGRKKFLLNPHERKREV